MVGRIGVRGRGIPDRELHFRFGKISSEPELCVQDRSGMEEVGPLASFAPRHIALPFIVRILTVFFDDNYSMPEFSFDLLITFSGITQLIVKTEVLRHFSIISS
ncbi:hypothetical protein GWI33_011418 [Rhynchophorus ferrugineus]|uniref:Uncharacterized protein n=1 Tax=Rhynchophorus ferrugineus TaxID=354439 RepID=A0A834IRS5_RHYFE|nr:hypothetical protein GWI33_011418 [Rhynchophorus ferrugineus]